MMKSFTKGTAPKSRASANSAIPAQINIQFIIPTGKSQLRSGEETAIMRGDQTTKKEEPP